MADIVFDPTGSFDNFVLHLKTLSSNHASVMVLACDANGFQKKLLDPFLTDNDAAIMGAVFPSVIYNAKKYDQGTLFIGLKDRMKVKIIREISQKDYEQLEEDIDENNGDFNESVKTLFVFIDGLTKNIGKCINVLFDNYGLDINYIGGGSGSLSFKQQPSIFTNQGLLQDAMVYGYSKRQSSIGVSHGWQSVSGPYQVTKAEATVIKELDYQPAFEIYKQAVDQHACEPVNEANFFTVARSFPFGINSISDVKTVRDPVILRGTELVCIGSVEEGSYVDILRGDSNELIKATKYATDVSEENRHFENDFTLFIDCISRALFLEEKFEDEISAVYDDKPPLVGALTFGEIANNGRNYLEFYNKTAVVGRIGYE